MNEINATHQGDVSVQDNQRPVVKHSNFGKSLSKTFLNTLRFGEISPHYCIDSVPKDDFSTRCSHSLETLSLKAPLMQDIYLHKDYFCVPLQAILPLNWEKLVAQPVQGDDVIAQNVNTVIQLYVLNDFLSHLHSYLLDAMDSLKDALDEEVPDPTDIENAEMLVLQTLFTFLVNAEYIYSNGSLLKTFGYSVANKRFYIDSDNIPHSFDYLFDKAISVVQSNVDVFSPTINGKAYNVVLNGEPSSDLYSLAPPINIRTFLDLVRDNGECGLVGYVDANARSLYEDLSDYFANDFNYDNSGRNLNYGRLIGYQLVCAHFFTNDHVDYAFTSDLYRENFDGFLTSAGWPLNQDYFSYNGVRHFCDVFSGAHISSAIDQWLHDGDVGDSIIPILSFIFAYRRSLRYMDYFSGARTSPLAVGDNKIPVQSGSPNFVSVIDVTKYQQLQKFRNSIVRVGSRAKSQIEERFGLSMRQDFHDPYYLGSTSDVAFASPVQNTGEGQFSHPNSRTSLVKSNASKFAFQFYADRPCYVIGVTYFDIPRVYSEYTDKNMYHVDRFDMYIPEMEYVGDQPLLRSELSPSSSSSDVFGYQQRYNEYKQAVDYACGGFCESLPGFSFLADRSERVPDHINPDFIRSFNSELDDFFVGGLTGYSLGTYFHFIVKTSIQIDAKRPMVSNPQILGK